MSITLAELRNRIASSLAAELGTKTYAIRGGGSTTVQALTIDDGNVKTVGGRRWEQRPIKHTGLECVIEPEVDSTITPLLNDDYYLVHTTRVTLKQFDVASTTKTARSLFIREFKNLISNIGPRIGRNAALNSVEQQTFTFNFYASS